MRWLDRLYEKYPRRTMAGMLLLGAICLYLSIEWDKSDTAAIQMQMLYSTRTQT
ncbi:hypothetical protein [Trinickia mobilis]|uniref:hypothetical protein n=1 Tax=Trinickia mobilis TaxID=2816356 RepID=UPI001A90477B|nr:hypothetical protein [Trinickia mobilis]